MPTRQRPVSMVYIQKGHCYESFVMMKAASRGPRYGEVIMKADQILILRLR